ncbi:MAG: CehA/McbA family metallohydrolase [Clostridia bacterium]|nr:CehA/McbA family metallohydrolase [Clostridia bacterium]
MKRQQAFIDKEKSFQKGGLHCHTTRSDGVGSPEEVMKFAHEHGFDFLALTDHQIYNHTNYAPETGILLVPGTEHSNILVYSHGFRCFHTVCVGPSPEDGNGFANDEKLPGTNFQSSEEYQPWLDEAHGKKNLTILCHPQWSNTSAKYFENQKGNFAMEIWNSGCALAEDCDADAAYWDELLGQGKIIYGVATDDAHVFDHLCKGWVMVKAEKDLNAILAALENGEFYSSCGPEIYDFYVDGDKVVLECSPVARARLHSDMHPNQVRVDENGNITRAEFTLNHWAGPYDYVRASIVDKDGKQAWTNPIFLDGREER